MIHSLPDGILAFLTVVETRSFTKAAEQLNVSRARISQIITKLEQDMGVQLLHRSTRSLSLTPAGETFYSLSKQGVTQLEHAITSAQNAHANIVGQIRINSVGGFFGEQILAPLLLKFMQQYPQIEVDLNFSSERVDVIESQFDLVIRMGTIENSNLVGRMLTRYKNYLVASPSYIASAQAIESPKDLLDHPLINGSVKRWTLKNKETDEEYEVLVDGKLKCSNGYITKRATQDGLGISRQPAYYVEEELADGTLVELLPKWQLKPSDVTLLYPQSKNISVRVRSLVDYLIEAFKMKGL